MDFGNYPSVIDVVVDSKLQYFVNSFETLKKQTVQDFELLLVVGWPGTATREYLATQTYGFNLVVIQEPQREKYPARASANNLGLDAATGNIYIGTQDDILFPENWIESHIDWHKKGQNLFISNRVETSDSAEYQTALWEHISTPRNVPIVARWQYASGHSFSLPMRIAKTLRHEERFNAYWGFEDIYWSYCCFKAGCTFEFDTDVVVTHQEHGDNPWDRARRSMDGFWQWLQERSRNRRLFYELAGFCPEYGILKDGLGYEGEFKL